MDAIDSLKYMFNNYDDVLINNLILDLNTKYSTVIVPHTTKDGIRKTYIYYRPYYRKERKEITSNDWLFIDTHTVTQIAHKFNKSTTWALHRKTHSFTHY